jgi:two-component system sensor histidine kinase UhpB
MYHQPPQLQSSGPAYNLMLSIRSKLPGSALLTVGYAVFLGGLGALCLWNNALTALWVLTMLPVLFAALFYPKRLYLRLLAVLLFASVMVVLLGAPDKRGALDSTWPWIVGLAVLGELIYRLTQARERAEASLQQARDELEMRVQRRTAELATTVQRLEEEIAERKRTEQALQESETLFRTLVNSMEDIVFMLDTRMRYVGVYGRWMRRNGLSPELFLGRTAREILGDEAAIPHEQAGMRILSGEMDLCTYDWSYPHSDGIIYHFQTTLSPLYDVQGSIVGLVGVGRDVTKMRMAEQVLRRQHAELTSLHETALGLLNRLDHDELLYEIVTRAGELLGTEHGYLYLYEPERDELVMKVGTGMFAEHARAGMRQPRTRGLSGRALTTGQAMTLDDYQSFEDRLAGFDQIRAIASIPLRSGGQAVGVIGLVHTEADKRFGPDEMALLTRFGQLASLALDNARLYAALQEELQERRCAEETLRQSEERFQLIARSTSDVVWDWDLTTNHLWWSDGLRANFGFSPDDVERSIESWYGLIHPEDRDRVVEGIHRAIESGEVFWSDEYRFRKSDSSYSYVYDRGYVIKDASGKPVRMTGSIIDITERKALEARLQDYAEAQTHLLNQLMHAQEAERRRLSMEVHDGPLQSLGVALMALDRSMRRRERGEMELADQELRYLRSILEDTVAEVRAILADLSLEVLTSYGLVFALRSHAERFSQATGIKVTFRSSVPRRLPPDVELLFYRLAQEALANVRKHASATKLSIRLTAGDGKACMRISDDGVGFDVERVLTPGRDGERLGLRSMRQRVHAMGGGMVINSASGKGTTLEFWCPVPVPSPAPRNYGAGKKQDTEGRLAVVC